MDPRLAALLDILERSPAFRQNPSAARLRQVAAQSPGTSVQITITPDQQIQTQACPPDAPVLLRHYLSSASYPGMAPGDRWLDVGQAEWVLEPYWILSAAAEQHFQGQLVGRLILGHGLGSPSGSWPLAATFNGAACLALESDAEVLKARLRQGWIDFQVNHLDEALRILKNAVRKQQAITVGLEADAAQTIATLARIGVVPDLALVFNRDESASRHDPALRAGLRALENLGTIVFAFASPQSAGAWPGCVPYDLQPMLRRGLGPLRWLIPQAGPRDMTRLDARLAETFVADMPLARWLQTYSRHFRDALIPSRAVWLDANQFTAWQTVLAGEISARNLPGPVLFCRDEIQEHGGRISYFVFPSA